MYALRWALALVLALTAGAGVLYGLTDGFTVLTSEGARRQEIARHPRKLPPIQLLDQSGKSLSLADSLRDDGRVAIINFFYSRCLALCLAQGLLTQRMEQSIAAQGLQDRVRLISISFDPRDRRAGDLARYAARMSVREDIWQFMVFAEDDPSRLLLDEFGIMVVPAPLGEFEHNAAFHVVSPAGSLVRIIDLEEPGGALSLAAAMAEGRTQ